MPIIKSALKKMRQDSVRRERNLGQLSGLRTAMKRARTSKKFTDVSAAYAALDRAVKAKLVKRNFADRQKAALSKLAKPVKLEEKVKKTVRKVAKKTSPKSRQAKRAR